MMNRGIHVRTIDDLLNMKLDTEIGKGKMDKIFPTILKVLATARYRRNRSQSESYSKTTNRKINISKSDSELIAQNVNILCTENVHKQLNS